MTTSRARTARTVASLLVLVLALGACAEAEVVQRQPAADDDGLQATGQVDGGRLAISSGGPQVLLADCDPRGAPDRDLCIIGRTIDGESVAIVIENPAVLVAGETVPVRADDCTTCDDVTGHAVVDLRLGGTQVRATSGRLVVSAAGERYTTSFRLRFGGADQLVGEFNVLPGTGGG